MRNNAGTHRKASILLLPLQIIVFSALLLLAAGAGMAEEIRVDWSLDLSDLEWNEAPDGWELRFPASTPLRDFGNSRLPLRRIQVLIPRDHTVSSVDLMIHDEKPVAVPGPLARDAGQPVEGGELLEERVFDSLAKAEMYPSIRARIASDQYHHGYHLVAVEIFPVREQLAGDQLSILTDATLLLKLSPIQGEIAVVDRLRPDPAWHETVRQEMLSRISNPQDLDLFAPVIENFVPTDEISDPGKTPSLTTSPVKMLIITGDDLVAEFQRLADHRTQLGIPTLVVSLTEILENYRHGCDLAESIRMYIIDAYAKWGVDFVLLGGDVGVIPPRYATSTFYPPGGVSEIPAELYFAALDGNWNLDGDDRFAEAFANGVDLGDFADFTPEVSVGRAPVNTPTEAGYFVDKVLAYEMPITVDHLSNMLLLSEVLFPYDWEEGETAQLDGSIFSEDIMATGVSCDVEGTWDFTRFYQNYTDYPGSLPELKADVLDSLNTGNFGLVSHIGHGFYYNMSVGNADIGVADAGALTNGSKPFLLYSLNCSSAAFDFNCLMERFIQNGNGGSVASLGSARAAFPTTADQYQQAFFDAMFCDRVDRLGPIHDASRINFTTNTFYNTSDRWTHLVYTLLGDPSLRVWTSRPREAAITAPASLDLGENIISIDIEDLGLGGPYGGVTVALSKDGEDYAVGETDASGNVVLEFAPESLGDVTLWISGSNALPQSLSIPVSDPSAPFLHAAGLSFVENGNGGSQGNGNGLLEGGEIVELTPLMHNSGTVLFTGGNAVLRCDDSYITLQDSTAILLALGPDATAPSADSFRFEIDTAIPDAREITFRIVSDDGGSSSWTDSEVVLFASGELELLQLEIDDSTTGDGDGEAGLDEEVELIFTFRNFGSGSIGNLTGTITSSSPNVVILDAEASWPGMPDPLATTTNTANVFRVKETDISSPNLIDMTLIDDVGRIRLASFDLRRPSIPEGINRGLAGTGETVIRWTPGSDSDLLGYRVYRKGEYDSDFSVVSEDIIQSSSIFRDGGLPALSFFEYFVVAVDQGTLDSTPSDTLSLSTAPPELPGYPLPMGLETSGDLAVGHLDTDGVPDMVVGSDKIYVIDGDGAEKLDGDSDSQTFGPITDVAGKYGPASIALGNLDGDSGQEIVASSWGTNEIYVFDEMGNILAGWPVLLSAKNWSTPALGDLDNDGDLEIVINDTGGRTYAFHHDGSEVADGDSDPGTFGLIVPRRALESYGRTSPALYDVDGDGDLEILIGSKFQNAAYNEYFYAYKTDGSGGNAIGWPKELAPFSEFLASPTVADINDDLIDEIIVLCENDSLYVWRPDGTRVAPFPQRYVSRAIDKDSLAPSVAVGDFTGDGNLEMVVCETIWDGTTEVNLIDHAGYQQIGWPKVLPTLSEASPIVGDINGDGSLDVVFGIGGGADSGTSFLYAWNMDGSDVEGFPMFLNGFVRATPFICDFNNDGNVNILLASWDKLIHAWDMGSPYDEELVPWPTFRGNIHRDGVLSTVVPTQAQPGIPTLVQAAVLMPNIPNPFNPSTRLIFKVPAGGAADVRLDIFDARGRFVVNLVRDAFPEGAHEVRWLGENHRGEQMASGVYYAQLSVDGRKVPARKLALVK